MRKRFAELAHESFDGAVLIVDIDGTLTNDNSHFIEPEIEAKIRQLASRNSVYLSSNSSARERIRALARQLGVNLLDPAHKKPSPRLMENIETQGKRVIVIGDKAITDGRFARAIGAEYVPIEKLRHADDRLFIRAIYFADEIYSVIRLMRPMQWVKNVLVFAPVFFADSAFEPQKLLASFYVFAAFCFASSAVYVMNDVVDADADRLHPKKRNRPLANGEISKRAAYLLLLLLAALSAAALTPAPAAAAIVAAYAILNIAYSFALKHIAILDIIVVASFYVMRVFAGGEAAAVYVSPWIVLCVFFGALIMIIGKRRAEFRHAERRKVIEGYSQFSLDILLVVAATLAIISYALWSVIAVSSPLGVYSILFVAFAIFRVLNRIFAGAEDAEYPELLVFRDKWTLAAFAAWVVYMFAIFYIF